MKDKLDIKKTILLSFGFFGSSLVWSVYSVYVPLLLNEFVGSAALIGIIMSIDSFFGVVFQPLFGKISDRTRTRFGRRLPYLFVCMPISAAFFIFIPYMNSLWSLMALAIAFTFVMSIWRTPAVSLMPDSTPGPLQSQGNGIVNLMGGVGAVIAFIGGGILFDLGGFPLPFLVSALLMLGAMVVVILFVREPKHPPLLPKENERRSVIKLDRPERRSLLLILFAVFFCFMGNNSIEVFFSLYAIATLGVTPGQASIMLAIFVVSLILFAIPAGILGAKIGRRKTILIGLVGVFILFLPLIFVTNPWIVRGILLLGGIFWSCVISNALPMIVRIAGSERIGTFIGYYYLFSFSAQLITTPLYGLIYDIIGNYQSLFAYACITFILAIVCLLFVKHGEEDPQDVSLEEADVHIADAVES